MCQQSEWTRKLSERFQIPCLPTVEVWVIILDQTRLCSFHVSTNTLIQPDSTSSNGVCSITLGVQSHKIGVFYRNAYLTSRSKVVVSRQPIMCDYTPRVIEKTTPFDDVESVWIKVLFEILKTVLCLKDLTALL